ncbi:MAG TPA: GGDEF domain-containing protein, partial [Alteromonas mediterranea]|nr:GGDEF domain-containing protein [Alteromonas mediterranea]
MDYSSLGKLLRSAQQDEAEAKRRRLTLYFISYVGGTIMAFMAWLNVGNNTPLLVGTLTASAAVVYINVLLSHIFPRVDVFYYVGGLVVMFTVNGLVYTGGLNNTGLYFVFPLLFVQIIVVRFRPALIYVSVTLAITTFMLYNQENIIAQYS